MGIVFLSFSSLPFISVLVSMVTGVMGGGSVLVSRLVEASEKVMFE